MLEEQNLYNNEYFGPYRTDPRRAIAYKQDCHTILALKPDLKNMLDVGGGTGDFGKYFNCEYYNYDPFTGQGYSEFPNSKFDVVVFRGTLQHIYNPVEMLMKAQERLNRNGLLAILATPDYDSLGYFRWGTLPALDAPRNWIPFGHRMLKNILERLEFKNIHFQWPYGYPYANKPKNLWNFIIGKPDAFPGNMMECFANV